MTLRETAKERPLLIFFSLAYLFAWLSWLPLVLSQTGIGYLSVKIPMPYVVIGTFGPSLAALITQKLSNGKFKFFNFQFSWKAIIIGLPAGFALIALAFVIIPSAVLTSPPLSSWNWKALALYPSAIIHMIFLAGRTFGRRTRLERICFARIIKII